VAGLDVGTNEGYNNQRKEYLYREIISYFPLLDNSPDLLYGDLELIYIRMLNAGTIPRPSDFETRLDNMDLKKMKTLPAGVTSMKMLDPLEDYYLSTGEFAAMTTDRPTGVTGAYFVTHSRNHNGGVIQTLTRNTAGTPTEYWRILYYGVAPTASAWQQRTNTSLAYSAT
jgi:hypothetical protein